MTLMQEVFAKEYLLDLNATQAAIRAGYSFRTARAIGHENLTKPDIQEIVQFHMNERAARTQISADKVIEQLSAVAFFNLTELLISDSTGLRLRPSNEMLTLNTSGIRTLYATPQGDLKIVCFDKIKALSILGMHLGIFKR